VQREAGSQKDEKAFVFASWNLQGLVTILDADTWQVICQTSRVEHKGE
jgi:hypothetical protein